MRPIYVAVICGMFAATSPAYAAHWTIDHAKSRLGFVIQWQGKPLHANFARWNADIDFDPTSPKQGKAVVAIDLASVATGQEEMDGNIKGAQGFDTGTFTTATFKTSNFTALGKGHFRAAGTLSLHGAIRPVTVNFHFEGNGKGAHVTGNAAVSRTAFGIAQGVDAGTVAPTVTVTMDLFASRAP